MSRPCLGRVAIAARSRRPDPFRAGLVLGFLFAAIPAAFAFILCLIAS